MNAVAKNPYYAAAERALKRQGGFYSVADIVEGTKTGQFQSFSNGESWAVTRIAMFPQRTALEVVFMLGKYEELIELEKQVIQFAAVQNIDVMFAYGRPGYLIKPFEGWKTVSALFMKELNHG